jgi:hypothetical protein
MNELDKTIKELDNQGRRVLRKYYNVRRAERRRRAVLKQRKPTIKQENPKELPNQPKQQTVSTETSYKMLITIK